MKLHADLTKPAAVSGDQLEWVPSPAAGVDRCMLDRDGAEVARATTVVRFSPNSRFPHHTHGGGEEYLVLEGTFHDDSGAYGPGCYVRNPIGSSHAPWTEADGCTIFVKLRQMHESDTRAVATSTADLISGGGGRGAAAAGCSAPPADAAGVRSWLLYSNEATGEQVHVDVWPAGASGLAPSQHAALGGEELFVVHGGLQHGHGGQHYPRWSWLRFPPAGGAGAGAAAAGNAAAAAAAAPARTYGSSEGCVLLRKSGHLLREVAAAAATQTAAQ